MSQKKFCDIKKLTLFSMQIVMMEVMKDGVIVESGTSDQIFDAPETDYTKALIAAAFDLEVAGGVSQ